MTLTRLSHTKPGQPQGRGRLERWFRTVADKFEPFLRVEIEQGKVESLADANNFLSAWIETRYHNRRHGTIKTNPAKALADCLDANQSFARLEEPLTIQEAFLWRESRQVNSLAAVKIYSNLYEVEESLIGKTVEIRYNPYDLARILVYFDGDFWCEAKPYRMKNFTEKRVEERQNESQKTLDTVAHELAVPMLSELRFVLNYQADSFSPLTIILTSHPQLTETLRLQMLECIRQRITVHYRLPSLGKQEVADYILHHLKVAGLDRQVFMDDAVATVYQFSQGIPRRINNLCRYALVAAIEADSPSVDAAAVQKGMDEAML